MTTRAHVDIDYSTFGIKAMIAEYWPDRPVRPYIVDGNTIRLGPELDTSRLPDGQEPTLRIDEDAARALLDALLDYFRGGSDTRNLRKDFEREQSRVDDLLKTVSDIARR